MASPGCHGSSTLAIGRSPTTRPGGGRVAPAGAFTLQILAGEPVIVVTTGIAAGILALSARDPIRRVSRLAAICTLAILLAAIQLLPAASRSRESARTEGLDIETVLKWSSPPQRAAELLWPRAWGDPMRIDDGLYFGWSVHDRQFAYLYSIYPGQLVLLLALAALLRWPVRYRPAWWLMIGSGVFLALGGYNPLLRWLVETSPLLSQIRFPEKFLLLATSALAFTAALGWQRLLEARTTRETPLEDFPLALAGVLAGLNVLFLVVLSQRPDVGEWFARVNSALVLSPETQQLAVLFFRQELLVALVVSLASMLLLALHRWRSVPRPLLVPLVLVALTADLWIYNRSLTPTVAAAELLEPPRPIAALAPAGERIFTDSQFWQNQRVTLKDERAGPSILWSLVERADPYLATLWNLRYAVHSDFDLMATAPAQDAARALKRSWGDPEATRRILGAWGVRHIALNRPVSDVLSDRLSGYDTPQIAIGPNPAYQDPHRFEPRVVLHGSLEEAIEGEFRERFQQPHWVSSGRQGSVELDPRAEIIALEEAPGHLEILYRSDGQGAMTLAHTWAAGWRASVDGESLPLLRGSLGTMGVFVPPGERRLVVDYREPTLSYGAAISLLTLATLLLSYLIGPHLALTPGRIRQ